MRLATHAVVIVIAIGFVSYSWISRATATPAQPVGSSTAPAGSLAEGGQVADLQVGRAGTIVKPVDIPTSVPVPRTATSYKVGANDTLESVAQRFRVSPEQIRWSNPQVLTSSDEVEPGQTLAIPPVAGVVVTVRRGDSLRTLAAAWHVDPETVQDFNDLRNPARDLAPGRVLVLPGARGPQLPNAAPPPPNLPAGAHGYSGYLHVGGPNPGGSSYNIFPSGQCTYYVASRITIPWNGDAWTWFGSAKSRGWTVGNVPRKGSIMVTWESQEYGHVAYVEQVYSDGSWLVSEMNYVGEGVVDQRLIKRGGVPLIGFIYPPRTSS